MGTKQVIDSQTKTLVCVMSIMLFLIVVFYGCSFGEPEEQPPVFGIVLSFDDYHPYEWGKHFDLFDKYGAKVTFFVTSGSVSNFMLDAQNRGHEIGFHTISHPRLPELSREQFFYETVSRIGIFRDAGIELTSFAYTFGDYEPWMNYELLKYYKIVRGAVGISMYTKDEMKSGFITATSIDNIQFSCDASFRYEISKRLELAKDYGKIVNLYSHNISNCDWGITPERLNFVLQKAKKLGLIFYTYRDLQE